MPTTQHRLNLERETLPLAEPGTFAHAGEQLESARAADQEWREERTERARRRIRWAHTTLHRLLLSAAGIHILVGLHLAGRTLGFNAWMGTRLTGTAWEWCLGLYEGAILTYALGLSPLIVGMLLYRFCLWQWARRQHVELEEAQPTSDDVEESLDPEEGD